MPIVDVEIVRSSAQAGALPSASALAAAIGAALAAEAQLLAQTFASCFSCPLERVHIQSKGLALRSFTPRNQEWQMY
jgi:hypothetical protein